MARISLVEKEKAPDEVKAVYEQVQKKFGMVPNIVKGLAHSPAFLQTFLPFLGTVLGPSKLDQKLKELAILTTTKLNGCSYCTAHHTAMGKGAGLTNEKIQAVPDPAGSVFDDRERAVIRFAKEVTEKVTASEEALTELKKYFSEEEIVELNLAVGLFNLLTRFADTFKIDLEAGMQK